MFSEEIPQIVFPEPLQAEAHGLLAAGGNLNVETLLAAYRRGIFPWYEQDGPILWWSPDPRMVLFPADFHCSRRLLRRMRQGRLQLSMDTAFDEVMRGCADRREGTWIHPEMMLAYRELFNLGVAHSVEVWEAEGLVGGLYGLCLGEVFFAESMFSRRTDASKMALAHLVRRALASSWRMIDCQFHTPHLASLGAREIPRARFLDLLAKAVG